MAQNTIIAWTDNTFNIAWGCVKVSPGCKHCYAEEIAERRRYGKPSIWGPNSERRTLGDSYWGNPRKWNRLAERTRQIVRVFSSSMCDNFEEHPTIREEMQRLWRVIRETPWIHWQVLTKRPERILSQLPEDWGDGYENVWLGTSVENNEHLVRIAELAKVPARIHFVSYEPALGPLDQLDLSLVDWVIYGGESGPNFRAQDDAWPREMRDMCAASGVAFFHKQSAGIRTEMGIELDGAIVRQMPLSRSRSCETGIH